MTARTVQPGEKIFRYEVPVVDDEWHGFDLHSDPLHVASRRLDVVEFWAISAPSGPVFRRELRVVGTGHPLPPGSWLHHGTVLAGAGLVWHLIERDAEPARAASPGVVVLEAVAKP